MIQQFHPQVYIPQKTKVSVGCIEDVCLSAEDLKEVNYFKPQKYLDEEQSGQRKQSQGSEQVKPVPLARVSRLFPGTSSLWNSLLLLLSFLVISFTSRLNCLPAEDIKLSGLNYHSQRLAAKDNCVQNLSTWRSLCELLREHQCSLYGLHYTWSISTIALTMMNQYDLFTALFSPLDWSALKKL